MTLKDTNYKSIITINNVTDLTPLADQMISHITTPLIFGLKGTMGSGKTTFIRYFGSAIGSQDWINSPTYSIIQKYQAKEMNILHIDLYRTKSDIEIDLLDIHSQIDQKTIAFIEWVDQTTLFDPDVLLSFLVLNETQRQIEVSSNTQAWVSKLK